jgi:hypothetical protein
LCLLGASSLLAQNRNVVPELPDNTIIVGETTSNFQTDAPVCSGWGFTYSQTIYHASELGDAGVITRIYYRYPQTLARQRSKAWDIYIDHIHADKNEFTSVSDWIHVDTLSEMLVFSGDVFMPGVNGWLEIILDRPFAYDGTSNLVVAVRESYPHYDGASRFAGTSTPSQNRVLIARTDSNGPYNVHSGVAPLTSPATGTGTAQTGTRQLGFPTTAFTKVPLVDVLAAPVAVKFGYQTYYKNVRIQNLSESAQNVTGAFLTGANVTDFSLLTAGASWGTISIGGFINIAVQFNPTTAGAKNAIIEIRDGSTVLQSIPLTGDLPVSAIGSSIFENFDTTPVGHDLPPGWKNLSTGAGNGCFVEIVADAGLPGSVRSVRMNNSVIYDVPSRHLVLISPPINNLNDKRVKFHSRVGTAGIPLIVGRMVDPFDMDTFVPIQTITPGTAYSEFTIPIGAGNGSFIAFRHGGGAASRQIWIDNVTIENVPTTPVIATSFTSHNFGLVSVGEPITRTLTITNEGAGTLDITNIHMEGHAAFARSGSTTASLATGATHSINVTFRPMEASTEALTSNLIITASNADNSPVSVSFSGTSHVTSILWSALNETFTDTTFPPTHWTRRTGSPGLLPATQPSGTTSQWSRAAFGQDSSHPFGQAAFFNNFAVRNEWLITRAIELPAGELYRIGFDVLTQAWLPTNTPPAASLDDDKRFVVLAKPQGVENWDISHIIAEWNGAGTGNGFNGSPVNGSYASLFAPVNDYHRRFVNIPPGLVGENIHIAFVGCSTTDPPDTRLYLDNISMEIQPTEPQIVASTNTLNFGNANMFGAIPLPERTITIRNTGGAPLTISSINPSLPEMGTITVSPSTFTSIAPFGQQVFTFTYDHGTFYGAMAGNITINSNDLVNPAVVINISAFTEEEGIVTIGTGVVNSTTVPVTTGWHFSYAQTIYYPAEIGSPGNIRKIYYHYNGHSSWANYDTWTIFMGHATQNLFTGTAAWATSIPHASLQQRFHGTVGLERVVPDGGWVEIELDQPFFYNGVDNLVIGVLQNISGYSSSATFQSTEAPLNENRSWRIANDSTQINPATGVPTSSITHSRHYPNIKLLLTAPEGDPVLAVSPASFTFPATEINFVATQLFTMANTGAGAITINSVTMPASDVFSITDQNFDEPLAGATTGTFRVRFAPTSAGPFNTTVTITPATGDPFPVEISGTCVDNSILWSAFNENFNAGEFPPAHWTRGTTPPQNLSPTVQPTGTSHWTTQNFADTTHEFGRSAYFNNFQTRNEWLVTPQIILGADEYRLCFNVFARLWGSNAAAVSTPNDKRFVVMAKRVGEPWSVAHIIGEWNGDGTGVGFNGQPLLGSYADLWTPMNALVTTELLLPASLSDGGIQIAFIGCSTLGSPDTRLYLDNVRIERIVDDAVFTITPASIDLINLGTVVLGNTVSRTFTIRNSGEGDGLIITGLAMTGDDQFSIEPIRNTPFSLDSNETHQFQVVFEATEVGPATGTLTIQYDDVDGDGSHVVPFTVNVASPIISNFPYIQTFTVTPGTNPTAGNDLFEFWRRHTHLFDEGASNTLPAPTSQTAAWWNASWGLRNFSNNAAHAQGTSAAINIYGSTTIRHWLVTPQIDIPAGNTLSMGFKLARSAFSNDGVPGAANAGQKLLVIVSTDNGDTWSSANVIARWDTDVLGHAAGTSMNMNSILNFAAGTNNVGYHEFDVDLTGYAGSIKIAFYAESSVSGPDFNFYIDDLTLDITPLGDYPVFAITPSSEEIIFPTTLVSESRSQSFTVRNIGGGDGLVIHSIELAATGHDYFAITGEYDISNPINSGNSIVFGVTYAPETVSDPTHTTTLTITYTDHGGANRTHTVGFTASSVDLRIFLSVDNPHIEEFDIPANQSPAVGHDLFDRWSRYKHTFLDTEPNTLPAPIAPTVTWWATWNDWGIRNFSNNATHSLGRAGHVNLWGSSCRDWLVTPTLVVPDHHILNIEFKMARSDYSANTAPENATAAQRFLVIISEDNGQTWESANVVARWDGNPANHESGFSMNMNTIPNYTDIYEYSEFSISLAGYSGEIKIAFYGESLSGGGDFNFYIDDLKFSVTASEVEETWAPPYFQSVVSGYDVQLHWMSPRIPAETIEAVLTTVETDKGTRTILNKSALEGIELPALRDLISYRIYRNDALIHTFTDIPTQMEFTWTDTTIGTANAVYTYGISAVYGYGNSPVNTVQTGINTVATYPWTANLSDMIVNMRWLVSQGETPIDNEVELFPSGWTRFHAELDGENNTIAGKSDIWFYDDFPGTTNNALNMYWGYFDVEAFADWAVSPTLNLQTGFDYGLSFDIARAGAVATLPDNVRLAVVLSTDNGVTWSESNIKMSWVGNQITTIPTTGINVAVPLGSLNGLHKIGFYIEQEAAEYDLDLWIGNIKIDRTVSEHDREVALARTGLFGNYPNPFNPSTTISFNVGAISTSSEKDGHGDMSATTPVKIDIFNIRGQHVRTLVDGILSPGEHSVVWNGTDDYGREAGSGIYFYRMRTDSFSETKKMILMK